MSPQSPASIQDATGRKPNPQPSPSIAVGRTFGAALQHHFKARVGQPSVQQHATAPQGRRQKDEDTE